MTSALKASGRLLAMLMLSEKSAMVRKKAAGLEKCLAARCLKKSAKAKFAAGLKNSVMSNQENLTATASRAQEPESAFVKAARILQVRMILGFAALGKNSRQISQKLWKEVRFQL